MNAPPLDPVDPPFVGETLEKTLWGFLHDRGKPGDGPGDYLSTWLSIPEKVEREDGILVRYHGYWYESDGFTMDDDGYALFRRVATPLEAALGEERFALVAWRRRLREDP